MNEITISESVLDHFAKVIHFFKEPVYKFILDPKDGSNAIGIFRVCISDEDLKNKPNYINVIKNSPETHRPVADYLALATLVKTEGVRVRYPQYRNNPYFSLREQDGPKHVGLDEPWIFYLLFEISYAEEKISVIKNLIKGSEITCIDLFEGGYFYTINN